MAYTPRKWMTKAVNDHLLPKFKEKGFVLYPVSEKWIREFRFGNSLGILRRHTPDGIQQVEVVVDRPGRTNFCVEFGIVPLDGIGQHSAEEIPVGWLDHSYVLSRAPWNVLAAWWRVRHWPWMKVKESDYVELAKYVATMIPEVEQVFENGKCGRHVKFVDKSSWPKGNFQKD